MDSNRKYGSHDSPNSGLNSAEYRAKLLTKLNCLIAVLQVAIAKISRSMDLPGSSEERLLKIRSNLENTLSICKRAKGTLEKGVGVSAHRKSPGRLGKDKVDVSKMSYRDYVELSSIDEYKKFKTLPPIEVHDLNKVDLEDLIRKLSM